MCKHMRHQGKGDKQLSSHQAGRGKTSAARRSPALAVATCMDTKRLRFIVMGMVVCFGSLKPFIDVASKSTTLQWTTNTEACEAPDVGNTSRFWLSEQTPSHSIWTKGKA